MRFKLTQQIQRYFHEIVGIYEDFNLLYDFDEAKTVKIRNYKEDEEINPRVDLENQEFWSHLEEIGAIQKVKNDKPRLLLYSVTNLEDKFFTIADTTFIIKDIQKIKDLGIRLGVLEKEVAVELLR